MISLRCRNLTVAMTWKTLRMKSVRNTPRSGMGSRDGHSEDREFPAWRRIRRAVDGYASAIVRVIGESYGKDSVQRAWHEFTIWGGGPFLGDDPHAELFFSWLFHRWAPALEEGHKIDDDSYYGVQPTRAYLARHSSGLNPLQRRYLEACLEARFSFYEILDCNPHVGFKVRDVLAGRELEVSEGRASTTLKSGDIVFAHIVPIDGTAMMEAISPLSFPATLKAHLIGLRRRPEWERSADLALRRLYFRLLESYWRPALPEVCNTDGEVIEGRTLYFDIESAQRAFDALAPLAFGVTRRELLEGAKLGARGELSEATIPWLKEIATNDSARGTTLLGYIHIRGRKLVVEVNSAQRAKAFGQLILDIPDASARYRRTRKHPFEKMLQSLSDLPDRNVTRH
jgi:hypothetical protein